MLNYVPSPTGQKFLDDRSFVKLVMGPVGGGKSTLCLMDLLARAVSQTPYNNVRRTKMGILRNTVSQLKTTVKPMIDQWFVTMTGGTMGQWEISNGVFVLKFRLPDHTIVHSDFAMVAADNPDDVRRLLSMELSAGWAEEFREIDQEVFEGFMGRVNRYPARIAGGVTYPGVIGSTNAPQVDSYWEGIISNPPPGWEVFIQPPALLDPPHDAEDTPPEELLNPDAENLAFLAPDYYKNLISGKSDDWLNVYMRNKFGAGNAGQSLYKGFFRRTFHVSAKPVEAVPMSGNALLVGMDNGLQSAAVIAQRDVRGRVNVVGECFVPEDQRYGVETFLDTQLIPYIREKFPLFGNDRILFIMDPACWARSQVDEKTIADAVTTRGFKVAKAPTNDLERRIQAVSHMLTLQVDGQPGLLISSECRHLANSLDYGHRYKNNRDGSSTDKVEKNHFSHIGDALQYLCLHTDTRAYDIKPRPRKREVKRHGYVYV